MFGNFLSGLTGASSGSGPSSSGSGSFFNPGLFKQVIKTLMGPSQLSGYGSYGNGYVPRGIIPGQSQGGFPFGGGIPGQNQGGFNPFGGGGISSPTFSNPGYINPGATTIKKNQLLGPGSSLVDATAIQSNAQTVGSYTLPQNGQGGIQSGGLLAGLAGIAGLGISGIGGGGGGSPLQGFAGTTGIQSSLGGGFSSPGLGGIGGSSPIPQQGGFGFPQTGAAGGLIPLVLSPAIKLFGFIKTLLGFKKMVSEVKPVQTQGVQTGYDQYYNYLSTMEDGEFNEPSDFNREEINVSGQMLDNKDAVEQLQYL